jgi:phosphoglycerol transferase MdoB-like AlkP superfamily enzyme
MTDKLISPPGGAPAAGSVRPKPGFSLRPATVYRLTAAILALIVARLAVSEGGPATVLLATFICASTGLVVVLFTRRLLFAAVLMLAQVAIVTLASSIKLKYMNMVAHAYDLAFYLTSSSTLSFLWDSYRFEVLCAVVALSIATIASIVAYRIDPVRVDRRLAASALLLSTMAASTTAAAAGERRHSQFEYEGMYLSSFYRSWAETIETLWRGQLIEAGPLAEGPQLQPAAACEPQEKPPHIILIHQESVVPPSIFAKLDYDRRLDSFFRSDNGQAYRLRVETYGGASVLTEFSVMTGLSSYSFGGMRLFVQRLMAGKIKETIPKVLKNCGYRTTLFYPMLKSFTFADRFFTGAGIDEIFDLKSQKAKRVNERDRFYYNNALDEIDRHIAVSDRPMFAFIETMAAHWPYDKVYEPDLDVPGGGPGTHPEMHEYLRRLWIANLDYEELRADLARRFPGERFLLVRYGDHHPMSTRMLLGFDDGTEAEDVLLDRNSIGYHTFFAVNGVGFEPVRIDSPPLLDVAYLGTVLLEASGLPLTDAYKQRKRLKEICEGRSFDCPKRDMVLSFHRRLIDAGLVSAR